MNIIDQFKLQDYKDKMQHMGFGELPKSDQIKFDALLRQQADETPRPNFTDDYLY